MNEKIIRDILSQVSVNKLTVDEGLDLIKSELAVYTQRPEFDYTVSYDKKDKKSN